MKNTVYLLFFLLFVSMDEPRIADRIIGEWEYADPKDPAFRVIFSEEGHMTLINGKDSLGGAKDYMEEFDTWCKLTYKTDYSKTPHHIDIAITELGSKTVFMSSKGIFEFKGELLHMDVALDGTDKRATSFTETSTLLKRVK